MPKRTLRDHILSRRRGLTVESIEVASSQIARLLLAHPVYEAARSVALYMPIRCEVETADIFRDATGAGKRICYPRVEGDQMLFVALADPGAMVPGAFGIAEPVGPPVDLAQIDLWVVPGVVFDQQGHRLGYGKGFYDRLFDDPAVRGVKVGICFSFQVVEHLPREEHDIPMDYIITENGVTRFAE